MFDATESRSRRRRLALIVFIAIVGGLELYIAWLALHPQVSDNYRAYYIDQTTTCLDKPTTGQYALGETVSFMADDQRGARRLRVCGWDGPGGDGTHSVGTRSMVRFAVPKASGDLILHLQMAAIVAPDGRDQQVVVWGNGISLGQVTLAAGTIAAFDFPVSAETLARGDSRLDVALAFPDAVAMAPNDSDTHWRAIKLMSVQLRRPGDRPSAGAQDDPMAQRYEQGP